MGNGARVEDMMTSRERVRRTLRFEKPDRVPRDLWLIPAVEMFRLPELNALTGRFPLDFAFPNGCRAWNVLPEAPPPEGSFIFRYGDSKRGKGRPYVGNFVDAWGCGFEAAELGVFGEVKNPPLAEWSALDHFSPPWEILEGGNWHVVNRFCAATDKFVVSPPIVSVFERMQFIRGTEALLMDLGYGVKELLKLRDMIHEFNLKALEHWCNTDVDGVSWGDDWGSQNALLISPQLWREMFGPLYKDYCDLIHSSGKFSFMHSDGQIAAVVPDLIEMGVDALNSQLFCMDIEELGRLHKGKVTFWGEIDRQHILPFGTPEDARQAVRRVRRTLGNGDGGVIAQCQFGKYDPKENIEAVFEAWLE